MGLLDDFYARGTGVSQKQENVQHLGEDVGAPYFTPGSLGQEMLTLASRVKALDFDIKSTKVDTDEMKDYAARWDAWVKEFVDWGRRNSNYFDRMFNVTKDTLDSYRAQFDAWKREFEKVGGKVASKAAVEEYAPKTPEEKKSGSKPWSWWQWAITGGLILGTGAVVFRWLGPTPVAGRR